MIDDSQTVGPLKVPAGLMQAVTGQQAWHYRVLPKERRDATLVLFGDVSLAEDGLAAELEILLGLTVEIERVPPTLIDYALAVYFPVSNPQAQTGAMLETDGEAFLMQLIREAKNLRSSDIHIETYQNRCRIRIRIDGVLVERYSLAKADYPALVNQIKILANLDIAEKRLPQDGRIFYDRDKERFDIRVSVLPTLYGEKVVMRILNQDATRIDIQAMGFEPADLERYMRGVRRPTGILLISGPTGSGKTTTLYATLKLLNHESRNILTIEDPIEYTLEGINQVQLRENIGLGFASALRTFLRQDPNVIMVGEIRDLDTANMAIRTSLTGHLVLSTIHTNSAWGTVSRLMDMGVPPFLIADTLHTTVAQRLVRLLCPHCKKEGEHEMTRIPAGLHSQITRSRHYVASGCAECHHTGYKGRKAVYEVIHIDPELSDCIKERKLNVEHMLKEKHICTLAENALSLFDRGYTSAEEIQSLLHHH